MRSKLYSRFQIPQEGNLHFHALSDLKSGSAAPHASPSEAYCSCVKFTR